MFSWRKTDNPNLQPVHAVDTGLQMLARIAPKCHDLKLSRELTAIRYFIPSRGFTTMERHISAGFR